MEYQVIDPTDNVQRLHGYWQFLIIIGIYYLTPSIQVVLYQETNCHYNVGCSHQVGTIHAFNNVISNIFYILFGVLYIVIVANKEPYKNGITPNSGTIGDKSLYYSLGVTLILEGISSAIYHICPSRRNFQFDTTFMIMGIILSMLTLYNKRHRGRIMSAFKFYIMVFFVLSLNVLALTSPGKLWFWAAMFLFCSYLMIFGSIYLYYGKEYELDMTSFNTLVAKIKTLSDNKMDQPRFILLVVLNIFTLGSCIYAALSPPDFTGWILIVVLVNMIIYFIHYLVLKYINGETIYHSIKFAMFMDAVLLITALYFYINATTNIFLPLAESNTMGKPCVLFGYFDNHDIWHILSASALFIFMNIILFLDDDMDAVISETIVVF